MRKLTLALFVCLLLTNISFSQSNNYNWITPNKTYLKLFINDDGMYRINKVDFENAGVSTGGLDPRTVKVLYKGSQLPIFFQGEDDGTFDNSDYFDFYGKRNYGGPTPHRDGFSNAVVYTVNEYYNLYSDTSSYWVEWGGDNGLRMEKSVFVSPNNFPDNYFYKHVHFEKDVFYNLGETTNPNSDYRYFSNEIVVGEGWFWRFLTTSESFEDTTYINDLSASGGLCSLKVFIKPVSFTNVIPEPEHRIEVKINDVVIDTLYRNNLDRIDTTITFASSFLTNNISNKVTFHYIPLGNEYFFPGIFIDFFDLYYPRDFAIRNNSLLITSKGSDTASVKYTATGHNAGNQTNIYDIINNIRIENSTSSSGNLTFTGKGNSTFRIINDNITKKPARIIQRSVRDLVNTNNEADYLIVYNKIFESQAEQLKNHRVSFDNFRVYNAEMQDIYDVFNYGMEDPVALRYFVKYVHENWKTPQLKYVCLFGRASLDPKKSNPGNSYTNNYVPTYGNPPSDGYFVNFNIGTYTYYHQISIGRVPVYTVTEAQDAVNKIVTYDQQPPDVWWKKYIAITGGGTRAEQLSFQNKSNNLINQYITNPKPSMNVSKIYRNDSTGYITYNYKDSIKREIDKGALIINFIGHAAAQDWEIGLENPNTLENGNKQPLVLSFTCYTGKNAEPNLRSFGEEFFLLPNKCAIGFVGTTGWSFSGVGDNYNEQILRNFSVDSIRRIGDLVTYASKRLSADSNSFAPRNTINCYTLLGDPATSLLMPPKPEFDIKQNDFALSNSFPSLGEEIKLSVYPKNLGTYVDTVSIRFQLRKNGIQTDRKDTLIRTFSFQDTISHFFAIDSSGNYSMSVIIDPYRSYPQKFYNNDSIAIPITLRNLSYVPVKPLDNAVLSSGTFTFTGLNPTISETTGNEKIILQIDTNRNFNSPALQTFASNSIVGITTSFNVTLPVQISNTLYFTRTNAVINLDSSGWSETRSLIYDPSISDNKDQLTDSTYTVMTMKPEQYNGSNLSNVNYTNDTGFTLNHYIGDLYVKSFGSNANEASYFIINQLSYYSDGGGNTGYNFAKVRKYNGQIKDIKNFRMNSPSSSDSLLTFLNTYDSTEYIMAYYCSYVPGMDSIRQDAKNKLKEFGSIFADSLTIEFGEDNFNTWAFIGSLGAAPEQNCEKYNRYRNTGTQMPLDCQIEPSFQNASGSVAAEFGPSDNWKSFSWNRIIFPESNIKVNVYGVDSENNSNLIYEGLTSNSLVNIDTLNSSIYPKIRLEAVAEIDSSLGTQSPVFQTFTVNYVPPAELLPDVNSFTGTDTTVLEGDSVSFSVNYYNVGFIEAPVLINKWYAVIGQSQRILSLDTVFTPLMVDSMNTSVIKFSTAGMRDPKLGSDTVELFFETAIAGGRNELFSYNNAAITRFIIQGDTADPVMEVTYDGLKILNGDFIQANPVINLQFFDNSSMVISDTSSVKIYRYVNNGYQYVPYYVNGEKNPVIDISFPDNNFLQATVVYTPRNLEKGVQKFRYVARDITGNFADSIINEVLVDDNFRITDIANYPNPMKTETDFIFTLSGYNNPTSCIVKIFTVAGRVIKEINAPANIGYNSIHWDGKDNDGDYIANGVYLYKFILQEDSQTETTTQKLVVLR